MMERVFGPTKRQRGEAMSRDTHNAAVIAQNERKNKYDTAVSILQSIQYLYNDPAAQKQAYDVAMSMITDGQLPSGGGGGGGEDPADAAKRQAFADALAKQGQGEEPGTLSNIVSSTADTTYDALLDRATNKAQGGGADLLDRGYEAAEKVFPWLRSLISGGGETQQPGQQIPVPPLDRITGPSLQPPQTQPQAQPTQNNQSPGGIASWLYDTLLNKGIAASQQPQAQPNVPQRSPVSFGTTPMFGSLPGQAQTQSQPQVKQPVQPAPTQESLSTAYDPSQAVDLIKSFIGGIPSLPQSQMPTGQWAGGIDPATIDPAFTFKDVGAQQQMNLQRLGFPPQRTPEQLEAKQIVDMLIEMLQKQQQPQRPTF
jgi:hypothetical protein